MSESFLDFKFREQRLSQCNADEEARSPYRKVLYLRQSYPDNWVDSSFLKDLQRNVNVHPASLPLLLRQTLPITQHLACTFIFVSIFVRLARGTLHPATLLSFSFLLGIVFKIWSFLIGESNSTNDGAGIATPLIPLFALYLLSPALKTLTKSTTSDSIWALSGTLFAINLLFGDYRAIPTATSLPSRPLHTLLSSLVPRSTTPPRSSSPMARRAPLPSTLSLSAALSGSTVLASRLDSNTSVFSLLLFSTLFFGPFPLLRSSLTLKPTLFLTWLLVTTALVSLRSLGAGSMAIAAALLFGSSVIAPLVRGWLMIRYKDRIRGPWDQAVPRVE
ncbi:phosphatidylinositol N-acetylglucosaminyltransferase [Sporobolomyces salmoneus]|uniref:phosphatidylinositol N-acetylglucosaminyltransferase n=1 Tax=Sporobolomyces salmoneus TaxID=183962 RepID=UPI00317F86F7